MLGFSPLLASHAILLLFSQPRKQQTPSTQPHHAAHASSSCYAKLLLVSAQDNLTTTAYNNKKQNASLSNQCNPTPLCALRLPPTPSTSLRMLLCHALLPCTSQNTKNCLKRLYVLALVCACACMQCVCLYVHTWGAEVLPQLGELFCVLLKRARRQPRVHLAQCVSHGLAMYVASFAHRPSLESVFCVHLNSAAFFAMLLFSFNQVQLGIFLTQTFSANLNFYHTAQSIFSFINLCLDQRPAEAFVLYLFSHTGLLGLWVNKRSWTIIILFLWVLSGCLNFYLVITTNYQFLWLILIIHKNAMLFTLSQSKHPTYLVETCGFCFLGVKSNIFHVNTCLVLFCHFAILSLFKYEVGTSNFVILPF